MKSVIERTKNINLKKKKIPDCPVYTQIIDQLGRKRYQKKHTDAAMWATNFYIRKFVKNSFSTMCYTLYFLLVVWDDITSNISINCALELILHEVLPQAEEEVT